MSEGPSLRRVFAGYLRLRSPFNMTIDAVFVWMVSAVVGIGHGFMERWMYGGFGITGGARVPEVGPWLGLEAASVVYSFLYWLAFGLFFFACARVIADRVVTAGFRGDQVNTSASPRVD